MRLSIYQDGIRIFGHRPVLGAGLLELFLSCTPIQELLPNLFL